MASKWAGPAPRRSPTGARLPFTVQHLLQAGLGNDGVVTLEPLVLVLADEGGVVSAL